jgi:hypothetical protein
MLLYFYNFLRETEYEHAQTKGIYLDRTLGGDCHHCLTDGDINARITTSEKTGKNSYMSVKRETMGAYLSIVR